MWITQTLPQEVAFLVCVPLTRTFTGEFQRLSSSISRSLKAGVLLPVKSGINTSLCLYPNYTKRDVPKTAHPTNRFYSFFQCLLSSSRQHKEVIKLLRYCPSLEAKYKTLLLHVLSFLM